MGGSRPPQSNLFPWRGEGILPFPLNDASWPHSMRLKISLPGYRVWYNYDIAVYSELKRALGRDPSAYQLTKLPTANVQLSPNGVDETVYLFPFCATSKLRKLEITGNQRHFSYTIKAMQNPVTDSVWQTVYSDIGGALFEESKLDVAWDSVKVAMEDWVEAINGKRDQIRDQRRGVADFPNSHLGAQLPSGMPASASAVLPLILAPHGSSSAQNQADPEVSARQEAILNSIKQQRDAVLAATRQGTSHLFMWQTRQSTVVHLPICVLAVSFSSR